MKLHLIGCRVLMREMYLLCAHDCITLLLGSRDRYSELFDRYSGGTYWYSPGWIEQFKTPGRGYDEQTRYMEYVEKYGEDNAE